MSNILVINASGQETRVALIENGGITEYYLERKREKGIVGNIYKGRVVRVLPGMQAAFVDLGLDKAAFLYVADVAGAPDFSEEFDIAETPEGEHTDAADLPEPAELAAAAPESAAPAGVESAPVLEVKSDAPAVTASAVAGPAAPAASETPAPLAEAAPAAEAVAVAEVAPAPAPVAVAVEMKAVAAPDPAADAAAPADAEGDEEGEGEETDDEDEDVDEADAAHEAAEAALASANGDAAPAQKADADAAAPGPAANGALPQKGEKRSRRRGRGRRRGQGREARAPQEGGAPAPAPAQKQNGRGRGGGDSSGDEGTHQSGAKGKAQIQDLLKEGQEVIVQVVKDPIGTKGARVTCHISLPGRHLVFMPTVDHVGISRRIDQDKERRRLRGIVDELRPAGTGFIVRTVAEAVEREKLIADIKFLIGLWNDMARRKDKLRAPCLVHPDLDVILRSVRDLFSAEVEKLVIDDRAEYERILEFVRENVPALESAIELYTGDEPIFDEYGIEQELTRSMQRKVWLKSGGYLIVDQAEALTAVDVNSGRYTGKKNLEETITKINVEAAKEVVYQLRLRNIGGIIIIDFIDMDKSANRDKVFRALQEACGHDRAKTNVLKISDLGLVEMTRKRVRESVGRLVHEACVNCDGRGHVRSKITVAYEIMRDIQRHAARHREDAVIVNCNPDVAKVLTVEEKEALRNLMFRFNKTINVRPQSNYHQEQYDLHGKWTREERGSGKTPAQAGRQGAAPEAAAEAAKPDADVKG